MIIVMVVITITLCLPRIRILLPTLIDNHSVITIIKKTITTTILALIMVAIIMAVVTSRIIASITIRNDDSTKIVTEIIAALAIMLESGIGTYASLLFFLGRGIATIASNGITSGLQAIPHIHLSTTTPRQGRPVPGSQCVFGEIGERLSFPEGPSTLRERAQSTVGVSKTTNIMLPDSL